MHVQEMISSHPEVRGNTNPALIRAIEACFDCAQTCTSCADSCLAEERVSELTQCIRLCLDCADVCLAAGKVGSRRTASDEIVIKRLLETCVEACRLCAKVCDRHHNFEHCRLCAEMCRVCEQACRESATSITAATIQ